MFPFWGQSRVVFKTVDFCLSACNEYTDSYILFLWVTSTQTPQGRVSLGFYYDINRQLFRCTLYEQSSQQTLLLIRDEHQ